MRYQPGSFTKNYGWDEPPAPGLAKLHAAINVGFGGKLERVERDLFRQRHPDLDEQRQLVPVNFFLGNVTESGTHFVVPDELVAMALSEPHSTRFDMLALFALHLARVGLREGRTGHQHAARYLGDFIRECGWQDGAWPPAHLANDRIEAFLATRVTTKEEADTLHKCVTNYSFILNATGVRATDPAPTNPDQWLTSALRLTFDRLSIEEPPILPPSREALLKVVEEEQVFKLVAGEALQVSTAAEAEVDCYLSLGGYRRL